MKKWLLILFLLPFWANAQKRPLKVELIDFSSNKVPAYCGYQIEWGILKFKIKEAREGFSANEIILAISECPRETMENGLGLEKFNNQNTYRLTLGVKAKPSELPAKATEIFKGPNEKDLPVYWLTNIELEK